jgi:hypothetical protein
MGSLSAPFKAFMDATSHLQYVEKRWAGKIAAGFSNGASRGGDKQNSLVQLMTFAAQHQMHWVNLGLNYGNNRSYTNEDILNRDSYTLGMAGQADMDQGGKILILLVSRARETKRSQPISKEDWQFCWPFSRSPMGKTPAGRSWKPGISANDVNAAAFCFSRKTHPRRRALKCRLRVANRASITYRLLRVRGARSRQAGQLRETSSTCRDACRPKQFRARQRRCDGGGLSASGVDGQDPRRQ